ncbi:MAG: glycoside hydrolase family 99-like domain-containing protein [Paludibacteraceae bacterium]|nr:glycoside hydrolase family 99-like domain-containing protein [Paludibacteraceae bacterium]
MKMKDINIIAFYLPQFHPFKENDEWWGKGFTEWTNVGKAKSLFSGHNQPRVPSELGYYDLRLPSVREQQAQMARDAGVTAFCYWHYWFGNGKRLIPEVFQEVLESGNPDFQFCLGWANHSWYAKDWNADGTVSKKILMEQTYPGIDDAKMHFDFLLNAFQDKRYVKIEGKPLLYVFAPLDLPVEYVNNFRKWTKAAGFPNLYLVANMQNEHQTKEYVLNLGYDAVSYQRLGAKEIKGTDFYSNVLRAKRKIKNLLKGVLLHRPPFMTDYREVYHDLIVESDASEDVIPVLLPQWDHTPRSGWNGTLMVHAEPKYFYLHCKEALDIVKEKKNPILFLKSWNEWGEGNMMEPDLTYGRGFIEALRKAVDEL